MRTENRVESATGMIPGPPQKELKIMNIEVKPKTGNNLYVTKDKEELKQFYELKHWIHETDEYADQADQNDINDLKLLDNSIYNELDFIDENDIINDEAIFVLNDGVDDDIDINEIKKLHNAFPKISKDELFKQLNTINEKEYSTDEINTDGIDKINKII